MDIKEAKKLFKTKGIQIQCISGSFAICELEDKSDPMHDYCDWLFDFSEKYILEKLERDNLIEGFIR